MKDPTNTPITVPEEPQQANQEQGSNSIKVTLNEDQQLAVATFSQAYMYAVSGLQLQDMTLKTIDPNQFVAGLLAGLYAVSVLQEENMLEHVPLPDDETDYSGLASSMYHRYADCMTDTALASVKLLQQDLEHRFKAADPNTEDGMKQIQDLVQQLVDLAPGLQQDQYEHQQDKDRGLE